MNPATKTLALALGIAALVIIAALILVGFAIGITTLVTP